MIQRLRNLLYRERLNRFNMHMLKQHCDFIEVLKWIEGINKDDVDKAFKLKKMLGPVAVSTNWINAG